VYNWLAVSTNKLCPNGWSVPTDAEWETLIDFLGAGSIASGKLRESGTTYWNSPNTGANNESGFTALPGGQRISNGSFTGIRTYGFWWTSTSASSDNSWNRYMQNADTSVTRGEWNKKSGHSVRCIKD
jgi:uncharacterized protein (TIGR02145 family)